MGRLANLVKARPGLYNTAKVARDVVPIMSARGATPPRVAALWQVYPHTMLPPARLFSICDQVEAVNRDDVPGSIVECGVWNGGALALAALWDLKQGKMRRTYHGFDSFEGLPVPTEEDEGVYSPERHAVGAARDAGEAVLRPIGACRGDKRDEVQAFFDRVGLPRDRAQLHAGWFQQTLAPARHLVDPIAILRIDGDWYDSTRICLDEYYDLVSPGGYVIIDDYGAFLGCRRAVDEFRAAHGVEAPIVPVDEICVFWRKPRVG